MLVLVKKPGSPLLSKEAMKPGHSEMMMVNYFE
jgi:hypothetical protein